jgi:ABC-type Mn2+/Zn2+ transport system ATPase subunit
MFNEKHLMFKHKVDANNVKIIANREEVDEKSGKVTNKFQHDISCFSGGEKHKMSTASMLAFTDCIPVHKRTNILILDEIDAELDHDGKFRFTNDLLPILKKKYSSIFVISHDENVQVANIYDKIWHISKKNHVSTLHVINNE